MKKNIFSALPIVAAATALSLHGNGSLSTTTEKLQGVLDQVVAGSTDHIGVLASVSAPQIHLNWSGASGTEARDSTRTLEPDQPFRIASTTKVFVAAAIFRLIEDGRLGLYDRISDHISLETARTLESGKYDPKAITVAELLAHTSGLADFGPSSAYETAVLEHQKEKKPWTRLEQIQFAIQHERPVGRPGEKYYYSDTGYVILGEIIERVSGEPMATYVRQALNFSALGLKSTYWETLEPAPTGLPPRAHQYWGRTDVTDFDPSLDLYGGGGLVSTTADQNRFFGALLNGHLFSGSSTLAIALLPVHPEQPMRHPRALLLYTEQLGRHTCWVHGGYWGTVAMYCPDIDVALSVSIDQTLDDDAHGASANQHKLIEGLAAVLDGALDEAAIEKAK
jgi:D-alanyl-D-alanine carboxypeptidase